MASSSKSSRLARLAEIYGAIGVIAVNTIVAIVVLEVGLRAIEPIYRAAQARLGEWRHGDSLAAAYADMTPTDRRAMQGEFQHANSFVYAPWVQFVGAEFEGRHLTLRGLRRSNGGDGDGWSTAMPDDRHYDVYFFGGSTMQGSGVANRDTIPAALERLAPPARRLRAFNHGHGYWFSRQESVLFETLLRDGHRPDAAVFLDGLNDTVQPGSAFAGRPFFTPKVTHLFDDDAVVVKLLSASAIAKALRHLGIVDLTHHKSFYDLPPGTTVSQVGTTIIDNYVDNLRHTWRLCQSYQVSCHFFWQPVPFHRYHDPDDTLSAQAREMPVVRLVYERIDEAAADLSGFENLAGLLEGYQGQAFIDGFHYAPRVLHLIAERMLSTIARDWRPGGPDEPRPNEDGRGVTAAVGRPDAGPLNPRRRPAPPTGGGS